jgi:hypothetical protein
LKGNKAHGRIGRVRLETVAHATDSSVEQRLEGDHLSTRLRGFGSVSTSEQLRSGQLASVCWLRVGLGSLGGAGCVRALRVDFEGTPRSSVRAAPQWNPGQRDTSVSRRTSSGVPVHASSGRRLRSLLDTQRRHAFQQQAPRGGLRHRCLSGRDGNRERRTWLYVGVMTHRTASGAPRTPWPLRRCWGPRCSPLRWMGVERRIGFVSMPTRALGYAGIQPSPWCGWNGVGHMAARSPGRVVIETGARVCREHRPWSVAVTR